jgi:hypothetical protein
MRPLAALAFSIGIVALAAAETRPDAAAAAKAVAPFLDGRAVAVLHVDLQAFDPDALASEVREVFHIDRAQTDREKKHAEAVLRPLNAAGVRDAFVVASLADLPNEPPFVVLPLPGGADARALIGELRKAVPGPRPGLTAARMLDFEELRGAVVGGSPAVLKRLRGLEPEPRPEVEQAFAGAGGGVAQLALVSTTDARRVVEEVMPALPPQVGGGSVKVLTRGLRWGAARLDVKPRLNLRVTLQAADEAAAKEVHGLAGKALEALRQAGAGRGLRDFDQLAELLTPRLAGDRLVLELDGQTLAARLAPLLTQVMRAAERAEAINNLKQIGIALHLHLDAKRSFPAAASYDKQGKPLLSWRVHLLPYLEQGTLYKEFHLDEPWDSDHNKKLITRMPRAYATPGSRKLAAEGKTTVLGVSGKDAMFPPGGIGPDHRGLRIADVLDGTSNTIFAVDADDEHAAVWTRPEDLPADPKDPLKGLGFRYGDGFLALLVDGSVRFVSKAVPGDTLNAFFTRNGGEVVGPLP